jgi:hypothetical protein
MKKTYTGSCHCGKIRYEVDADLQAGTGRCNCSVCRKRRYWGAVVKPEDFRLLCEETAAADYQFATMSGHHRFCTTCGLHAYGHGHIEEIGGDYVSINVACLDDISREELAALPVRFMDGRHDNWWNEPAVTSYL